MPLFLICQLWFISDILCVSPPDSSLGLYQKKLHRETMVDNKYILCFSKCLVQRILNILYIMINVWADGYANYTDPTVTHCMHITLYPHKYVQLHVKNTKKEGMGGREGWGRREGITEARLKGYLQPDGVFFVQKETQESRAEKAT